MRLRTLATGLVVLQLAAGNVSAGIGIFSKPDGSDCNLTLVPLVSVNIYVIYSGGPKANGLEYRVTGMPGRPGIDYVATLVTPCAGCLPLGNPFDGIGAIRAWPAPQPFDSNNNVLLEMYVILVFKPELSIPPGTILRVEGRDPPTDPDFPCPLISDAEFKLHCQPGGIMRVNGGPPCTVAVDHRTWSEVRNLYR